MPLYHVIQQSTKNSQDKHLIHVIKEPFFIKKKLNWQTIKHANKQKFTSNT